ncbi:hypothetical protein LSH36_190g05020 [Paralvinella palmiformis]|uniref:Intraflagellar transport protein 74 homolog n=1 Tax=Paralvinella palmiformis TaxID=53620 RepID=A0AAD9JQG1_9ANNE|nr:hypothetical protein LSH36_190g05020 [Paralvinella palmiformis]
MSVPGSSYGNRPGSAARGPLGAKSGVVPPGTATRLTTAMQRPGSRGGVGAGMSLTAQVHVADRPMTQQGLGGLKTAAGRGPQRQIQDKSYFLGLLRRKMNELTDEISRLRKEVKDAREDQSSYVTYEKRAESLAVEIKEYQAELGDYNTLVDKLNTDDNINDIQMDCEELKNQNDRQAQALDMLFEQKQQREIIIKNLEVELQQERSMADNMVADMKPEMRQSYLQMKDVNEHYLKQLESGQQELDRLSMKKTELEEELAISPVKQEAVRLYEQLHELEEKKNQLIEETQAKGSPQEERDRLLKQVKEDNQEIASMDRQIKEIRERLSQLAEEIRQLDSDIEENQGERNQKYKELKKREESMDDFLESFEENKAQEIEKMSQLEQNVVLILEHFSRNLARFHHLPTPKELEGMKEDLAFKETEMKKSEVTSSGLAGESEKLHQDLQKVEQLEAKISQELEMLKTKIPNQREQLETFSDLDKVKADGEMKKKKLVEDKMILHKRIEVLKKTVMQLTQEYEALKAQLADNETYTQLGNLERKWQHHEQNNFVMKDFIEAKNQESDYCSRNKRVTNVISEYNVILQETSSRPTF